MIKTAWMSGRMSGKVVRQNSDPVWHTSRPKPVGNHILKGLWSKVSCHLDEQPQCSIEIDTIFSNDLAKSGRWMNFQRDADHLGNKVAEFVFDKLKSELLTELTLQLAKF